MRNSIEEGHNTNGARHATLTTSSQSINITPIMTTILINVTQALALIALNVLIIGGAWAILIHSLPPKGPFRSSTCSPVHL